MGKSATVKLTLAERIEQRERLRADAAFNRLLLEKGIGREFHSEEIFYLQRMAFRQAWWASFLFDRSDDEEKS